MNLPKELIIECMKYSPVFPLICKYFNSIYDSCLTKIIKDTDTTNCSRIKINKVVQINQNKKYNKLILHPILDTIDILSDINTIEFMYNLTLTKKFINCLYLPHSEICKLNIFLNFDAVYNIIVSNKTKYLSIRGIKIGEIICSEKFSLETVDINITNSQREYERALEFIIKLPKTVQTLIIFSTYFRLELDKLSKCGIQTIKITTPTTTRIFSEGKWVLSTSTYGFVDIFVNTNHYSKEWYLQNGLHLTGRPKHVNVLSKENFVVPIYVDENFFTELVSLNICGNFLFVNTFDITQSPKLLFWNISVKNNNNIVTNNWYTKIINDTYISTSCKHCTEEENNNNIEYEMKNSFYGIEQLVVKSHSIDFEFGNFRHTINYNKWKLDLRGIKINKITLYKTGRRYIRILTDGYIEHILCCGKCKIEFENNTVINKLYYDSNTSQLVVIGICEINEFYPRKAGQFRYSGINYYSIFL